MRSRPSVLNMVEVFAAYDLVTTRGRYAVERQKVYCAIPEVGSHKSGDLDFRSSSDGKLATINQASLSSM